MINYISCSSPLTRQVTSLYQLHSCPTFPTLCGSLTRAHHFTLHPGGVPTNLGSLHNLETLDLSENKLAGQGNIMTTMNNEFYCFLSNIFCTRAQEPAYSTLEGVIVPKDYLVNVLRVGSLRGCMNKIGFL